MQNSSKGLCPVDEAEKLWVAQQMDMGKGWGADATFSSFPSPSPYQKSRRLTYLCRTRGFALDMMRKTS